MSSPCAIFCSTVDQSENSCFCISLLWPEIAPTLLESTFTFRAWQTLSWPCIWQLSDLSYVIVNYLGSSGVAVSVSTLVWSNSFLSITKQIRSAFLFHVHRSFQHMGKIVAIHVKKMPAQFHFVLDYTGPKKIGSFIFMVLLKCNFLPFVLFHVLPWEIGSVCQGRMNTSTFVFKVLKCCWEGVLLQRKRFTKPCLMQIS